MQILIISRPLILVSLQQNGSCSQLVFQPPKFDWNVEDQQLAFAEWRGQIELALEVHPASKRIVWFVQQS